MKSCGIVCFHFSSSQKATFCKLKLLVGYLPDCARAFYTRRVYIPGARVSCMRGIGLLVIKQTFLRNITCCRLENT